MQHSGPAYCRGPFYTYGLYSHRSVRKLNLLQSIINEMKSIWSFVRYYYLDYPITKIALDFSVVARSTKPNINAQKTRPCTLPNLLCTQPLLFILTINRIYKSPLLAFNSLCIYQRRLMYMMTSCFLWCAPEQTVEQTAELPVILDTVVSMFVTVMCLTIAESNDFIPIDHHRWGSLSAILSETCVAVGRLARLCAESPVYTPLCKSNGTFLLTWISMS